jgi:hypothetical protein
MRKRIWLAGLAACSILSRDLPADGTGGEMRPKLSTTEVGRETGGRAARAHVASLLPHEWEQPPTGIETAIVAGPITVDIRGRWVTVAGWASVFDREPGHWFVWRLRAERIGQQPPAWERYYEDTATRLPAGQMTGRPAFFDAINLEPGTYYVQLALFVIPEDFGFDGIKPGTEPQTWVVARVDDERKITID